ncbi:hypothetical protein GQ54DRAFT_333336 [Martensiomyces pterosporus]|nr:hypothetical protein GQ54DRAFT_333336 [Martensiomyces pterosporus]
MAKQVTSAEWRTLYRDLLRATPRATSGKSSTPVKVLMSKVRQGFDENSDPNHTDTELQSLYRRGHNTLVFLKLAHELGSVERKLVASILRMHKERRIVEEKPPLHKRKFLPHQKRIYDETYEEYDRTIENIERDLDIILPKDKFVRSLEWIPALKNLHRGDPILDAKRQESENNQGGTGAKPTKSPGQ